MRDKKIPADAPTATARRVAIADETLTIQDHQAHVATFPSEEAPGLVTDIVVAVLREELSSGRPADEAQASAQESVVNAAASLITALQKR